MSKHRRYTKKTDQAKAWNLRPKQSTAYAVESRLANYKRFVIYCEGENTEPNYFKSFPVTTAEIHVYGLSRSKTSLVNFVIERDFEIDPDPEREVWIVFDMDFDLSIDKSLQQNDFNRSITLAQEKGFKVAYSNDAFELWFVLHHQLIEAQLTRNEFYQKLSEHWQLSYERYGKSRDFCRGIYDRLISLQTSAIRNAERLHRQTKHLLPAEQNPCTTVYELVVELNKYLKK
ncbi:MAG: RloB family protein [Saprospiraceae bacterium]|nr:RloB family protein [Saprospiraceae bacterium]